MDSQKIGKFILEMRQTKGMTQKELANKLMVTDKAISKWETGRGLPDMSLLKPLSEELCVTLNELLCGEKISKEDLSEKSEEVVMDTINYSSKKIEKNRRAFLITIIILIILMLIVISSLITLRISDIQAKTDLADFIYEYNQGYHNAQFEYYFGEKVEGTYVKDLFKMLIRIYDPQNVNNQNILINFEDIKGKGDMESLIKTRDAIDDEGFYTIDGIYEHDDEYDMHHWLTEINITLYQ